MSAQQQVTNSTCSTTPLSKLSGLFSLGICLLIAGCGGGGSSSENDSVANTTTSSISTTTVDLPVISALINNTSDDAEESVANGQMDLTSSDIELINETNGVGDQLVGLRYALLVPDNSTITNAYIQFTTDEVSTGTSNLVIKGENTIDAAGFTTTNYNISSRQTTNTSVNWTPPDWNEVGESNNAQRTPDLSTIIQEIIELPNWQINNHIAFIISGSGTRTSVSHNGSPVFAPKLHVEYTTSLAPVLNDSIPIAYPDTLTTPANTAATINILTNDQGIADTPVSISISSAPSNGNVVIGQNGAITYTPNGGYSGADLIAYQITDADGDTDTATITVNVTSTAVDYIPVANSDSISLDINTAASVNVLANDTGLENGGIVVSINSTASNGTISIGQNGTLTYTPNNNYIGNDGFSYRITDIDGDTSSASVNVTVSDIDHFPVANNDSIMTNTNISGSINILTNDTGLEDGSITVSINSAPANGNVSIGQNGLLSYTPNNNFTGSDAFSYVITDADGDSDNATVNITVNSNDIDYTPVANTDTATTQTITPVTIAVLNNDTGIEDGPITISITSTPSYGSVVIESDNTVTYTPNAGHFGPDSFIYTITDTDSDNAAANVSITVVCTSGICTKTIRVSWNANPESDLSGYYIHHGTQSGVYTDKIWVGNVTTYDFETSDLTGHFFAISATNTASDESGLSSEVSVSLAL